MIATHSDDGRTFTIIGTESDTHDFARHNPAGIWPCSALSGNRVRIVLDDATGDLIDGEIPDDVLADELSAFIDYALTSLGYAQPFIARFSR